MKIIPAVDIIDGKTVRLEQGRYDKELSYDMSPVEAAKQWEAMGAELLHVVDLDGAKMGRPVNLSVIENIVKAVNIPVEVGGGYRTTEDIQQALDKGLWRVIVGSRAFEDMEFAAECAKTFGDKVIFSVDVKNLKASVHGWERTVEVDVYKEFIPFLIKCGAREVIYTDISRDGMLSGPNIAALKHVLEHVNIRIISADASWLSLT